VSDAPADQEKSRLVERALGGDEEALGHVLAIEQEWAYNVAYRVLGREADAKDAVQDAFLLVVRAFRGDGSPPRGPDSFRPWLRRVVVNAALTLVRSRPAQPVPVDEVAEALPSPDDVGPGRSTEDGETRIQVLQALLGLPETQRVALALREYLNATYDEIGDVLDLPRTAIGTLLFRARAGFRSVYDRVAELDPPLDCPDVVPLLSAIVDEQPRPAAWNEMEHHLRSCPRCESELSDQRRARRLYALIPLLALPAGWEPARTALASAAASGIAGLSAANLGSAANVGPAAGAGSATGTASVPASAAQASTVASSAAMAAPGVAATASATSATGAPVAGGLLVGATGVKLAVGALAVTGAIGAVVAANPVPDAPEAAFASPSPAMPVLGSPVASPAVALSPGAAVSPVVAAGVPSPAASTPSGGTSGTSAVGAPSPVLGPFPGAPSLTPSPSGTAVASATSTPSVPTGSASPAPAAP
jgi:RNA polymerase sigma-70 factor, ECF subfamily